MQGIICICSRINNAKPVIVGAVNTKMLVTQSCKWPVDISNEQNKKIMEIIFESACKSQIWNWPGVY